MVEGLALAAFGFMHQMTTEPLLKKLLRYVMSDEARHVAFGVLSLQDYYAELSDKEIDPRSTGPGPGSYHLEVAAPRAPRDNNTSEELRSPKTPWRASDTWSEA